MPYNTKWSTNSSSLVKSICYSQIASHIFPNNTKYLLDLSEISLEYGELMNTTLLKNVLWAFEMARNMIGRYHIVDEKATIIVPDIFPAIIHIRD